MKIAVIAFELPSATERTGGVSHFNHRLCNMLVELGHDVTAYSVRDKVPDARYKLVVVPGNRGKSRFRRYYQAPWQAQKIDLSDFDMVLSSGDDWAMKHHVRPWIRIMHGSAWREMANNTRWLRKSNLLLLYALERLSAARADVILFNSKDTRKLYPHRKQDRIVHLPVDTRLFYPGMKSEAPTLMFVGGLDSRKRGRWLFELFVNRIHPAIPNARLIMICEPGDPAEGVEYIRQASLEQLAEKYREAHVFCMPSTYEGYGIPYLEAMASGTLVVTTPNPGAEELLVGGRYGWIVPDHELADSLILALQDCELHTMWTLPALEWARNHEWSIMLHEFLNVGVTPEPEKFIAAKEGKG